MARRKPQTARASGAGRSRSDSRSDSRSNPRSEQRRQGTRRSNPREDRISRGRQIEGIRAVEHALTAGRRRIQTVMVVRGDERLEQGIVSLARKAGADVELVGTDTLNRRAVTSAPQGVIAVGDALPEFSLEAAAERATKSGGFLIASDGIEDPGNLGAVIRTGELTGATGIVLPARGGAPLSPTVLKAAAGAAEYVDFVSVSSVAKAVESLKKCGIWSVVLDSEGAPIYDAPLLREPLVLIVGSEGRGVSRLVRERADLIASIPTRGAVESLNASAAVAAACSEILRNRSGTS